MLLEMSRISKSFPGVVALKDVDFSVGQGEVHALMGENGAGKSTLIKILTGLYQYDSGRIVFDGGEMRFSSPLDAQEAGISTVYQELNMIPYLSVSENLFLGRYTCGATGIDWKDLRARADRLMRDMGLNVDVRAPLNSFGTAMQQMVAIARAISLNCKLVVMDEPTSSLDVAETRTLFDVINSLKAKGISTIFITHRLDEVYQICDRISILKDGANVGTYTPAELPQYELINKMVGKEVVHDSRKVAAKGFSKANCIVELERIARFPKVRDVSLTVREGEVVGLAGMLGSGRTETAQVIFGMAQADSGTLRVSGRETRLGTPHDALRHGLAFCTENRREEGVFPYMTVSDNIVVSIADRLATRGFVNKQRCETTAQIYVKRFAIKTPSTAQHLKNLSGGNQQKVILARWLATKPRLIILDEPTRGIDVGAKQEVEHLIAEFVQQGIGVLYISSELSELVRNCDRVYVMRDGKVVGELSGERLNEDAIMKIIAAHTEANSAKYDSTYPD